MRTLHLRRLLLCSASILGLGAAAVSAQEAGGGPGPDLGVNPGSEQGGGFLGTIELGQSKREVQTQTAVPETVIDQEEIDDRQASTIAELIDSVPGVTLVNGNTPQGSGINIRGFGANGTYGTDNKVLVLVDGASTGAEELYRIGNQLFTDPELYKSVSVIRGTVGSFEFGSGVIGGVVQLETKDASDFTGGEIGLRFRQTLEAVSNGRGFASSSILAWQPTEDVEVLLNYTLRDQASYRDGNGNTVPNSEYRMPSYLLKGKYSFGDNREHALTLSYNVSTTDEQDVPYDSFGTTGGVFGNVDRTIDNRITALKYTYRPAGNDLVNLEVNLTRAEQAIDQTCLPASAPFGCFPVVDADHNYTTTKLVAKNSAWFTTGQVSHNLRAGFELSRRDRLDAPSAPGGSDRRIAFFAVDEMQIGSNFTLTPALRYEIQHLEGDTAPLNQRYDNDALMGGVSARYEWASGFAVFASAAHTEMLPIIDDLGTPLFMTQPEKSRTYEAGFSWRKGDLWGAGDLLLVKLNAYDTHVRDVTSYSLIDRVEVSGVELEASYSHPGGFYLDLNATSAEGTGYSPGGIATNWIYAPDSSARLTLGKRFGDRLDLSWELAAAVATEGLNNQMLPGYGVNTLRATYRPQTGPFEGAELRLGIENIFDKDYQTQLSSRMAPGRTFKLTLAKTF